VQPPKQRHAPSHGTVKKRIKKKMENQKEARSSSLIIIFIF
jgi:hypothetical protein